VLKKSERIKRKVVTLCCNGFFAPDINDHCYTNVCQLLNLRTLREGSYQVDAIFVINVFWGGSQSRFSWTLLVFEPSLGTSETVFFFMLVHP
jgi:hypothetical protein